MSVRTYHEQLTDYSPLVDGPLARLSLYDDHGGEHFALIPKLDGVGVYRAQRQLALDALADRIDAGADPGELRLSAQQLRAAPRPRAEPATVVIDDDRDPPT